MSQVFEKAVKIVIALEGGGGYSNHPEDPGGATKYGISKRAFPNEDIGALTFDRASALYKAHYWDEVRADELPPKLALCVFDCAVNQGHGVAEGLLQLCLNLNEDKIIGPKTIAMIKTKELTDLIGQYMARRARRYVLTTGYGTFGQGWMSRLFKLSMEVHRFEDFTLQ